jgi:8-oxo-dGTP diphosphatase
MTQQISTAPHIHSLVMCTNIFVRKDGKYLMLKRSSKKAYAPGFVHPFGGKIDPDEDPYVGAIREIKEEVGAEVTNVKLEAVILEVHKTEDSPNNWLIFYFSADYESGEIKKTVEGETVLLSSQEIKNSDLFPSVKTIIDHILNPSDGTVFTTNSYGTAEGEMKEISKNICIV